MFKLITKIVVRNLGGIYSHILSQNHFGFISNRNIDDYMEGTSKCFNMMQRPNQRGNIALKIDIPKTFDTMCWDSIFKIQCFGFNDIFLGWI